ncbi:uncharacterized protein PHALS_06264 [Plasmopara halstedii]|uniref:Uncharacterized protein n=1 Tax=Plasmopara halstedii TaxID=4781 RepID=A0A0P1B2H5_PLAHL|nr:uncharacterized protein PHALS_06264 [Plasmopara halstedii]CEG48444.1 hypothetical protein PHALS_06264 [Plasmopara halstedii]|eukprot:XP_024584813.1 hypothetical protein PHALS_06264 [Plasmopara halstedii]
MEAGPISRGKAGTTSFEFPSKLEFSKKRIASGYQIEIWTVAASDELNILFGKKTC